MARSNRHVADLRPASTDQRLLHALGVPFAHACETASTGFALVDADGTVRWATAAFSRLTRVTGASLGAPLGERLEQRFRLATGEAHAAFDLAEASTLTLIEGRDSAPVWLHVAALDGDRRTVVAVASNPELPRAEAGAVEEMLIDPVTRLGNTHRLERAIDVADTEGAACSLIAIGLDGFAALNALHGRLACDALLALVGDRLRHVCRAEDLVARLDGDRFAVLHRTAPGSSAHDSTARIATRVAAQFDEPLSLDAIEQDVAASVGIATTGRDTTDHRTLVAHAVRALAAAKRAGGSTWRDYEPRLDA